MTKNTISWQSEKIVIPDSAVNFALAANGSTAKASACVSGFTSEGVINGNRTIKGVGNSK